MVSYDKSRDYMWNRFKKKMSLLEDMDEVVYISPYWNTYTVRRNSHDDKWSHGYIRLLPADIINRPDTLMERMEKAGDCLCGYNHELFSKDPKSFMMELLLPDWCASRDYDVSEKVQNANEVSELFRNHSFNAPKVTQIVYYMRYFLYENFHDEEFVGLTGADCFYPDIITSWELGQDLYGIIYDLYMNNLLKRSD